MHNCSLRHRSTTLEETHRNTLKLKCLKLMIISPTNPLCSRYFRSETAIRYEKRRQLEYSYPYVIHPLSKFRSWYEIYLCFLYFILLMIKPFDAAFERRKVTVFPGFKMLILCLDVLSLIDVCFNFFTGYVDKKYKQIELDIFKIMKHYVTGPYFICDFLSSIPRQLPVFFGSEDIEETKNIILGCLTLLTILKFIRIITLMQLIQNVTEFFRFRLSVLFFTLCAALGFLILIQWVSCLTFMVPVLGQRLFAPTMHYESWIYNYDVFWKNTICRFVHAHFRGAAYMVGVRLLHMYYLITTEDTAYAIIATIFGRLIMASVWITIAVLIQNSRSMDVKYRDVINQLNEYMSQKQLPDKLKERLLNFYRFKYQGKYLKEEMVTSLLSEELRQEVNIHVCKNLIADVSIFSELTPSELSNVVDKLTPHIFLQHDVVFQSGTPGDCMYFISTGTVAVYTHSGKEVCHLQDGAYFGELALVSKSEPRITTIVAIEITQVYKLSRKNFDKVLSDNKKVWRKIVFMADQRYKQIQDLETRYKALLFEQSFRKDKLEERYDMAPPE